VSIYDLIGVPLIAGFLAWPVLAIWYAFSGKTSGFLFSTIIGIASGLSLAAIQYSGRSTFFMLIFIGFLSVLITLISGIIAAIGYYFRRNNFQQDIES
jgi:hypothetical protein